MMRERERERMALSAANKHVPNVTSSQFLACVLCFDMANGGSLFRWLVGAANKLEMECAGLEVGRQSFSPFQERAERRARDRAPDKRREQSREASQASRWEKGRQLDGGLSSL